MLKKPTTRTHADMYNTFTFRNTVTKLNLLKACTMHFGGSCILKHSQTLAASEITYL